MKCSERWAILFINPPSQQGVLYKLNHLSCRDEREERMKMDPCWHKVKARKHTKMSFWILWSLLTTVLSNKCLVLKVKQIADWNVHRYMIFLRLQSAWPSWTIPVADIPLVVWSYINVLFRHVEFWWKHEEKWSWLGLANYERVVPRKMQSWNSHTMLKRHDLGSFNCPN